MESESRRTHGGAREARRAGILLALSLLLASPAGALTVDAAPPEVIAGEATLVIWGTVVGARPHEAPTGRHRTWTRLELEVWDRSMRSALPMVPTDRRVQIVLPAGRSGDLETAVPGLRVPAPGEELIVALDPTPWGWMPRGLSLGLWFADARGRLMSTGEPIGRAFDRLGACCALPRRRLDR